MKSIVRAVSVVVALLLVAGGIFAAPGSEPRGEEAAGKPTAAAASTTGVSLPIAKTPITITYWCALSTFASQYINDMNGNLVYTEKAKRTNINVKFIHPPAGQEREKLNLIIASRDWPDVIHMPFGLIGSWPGGYDKAISDGVLLRLNDLVSKYAPNFAKVRALSDDIRKQTMTDDGSIYGFPMIETEVQAAYVGPIMRKDWLDDLGLKVPVTMDDWYAVLKGFKEQKGAVAPMLFSNKTGVDNYSTWVGAYGVGGRYYQVNGKVKYGPIEPAFLEYLTTFQRWYAEGLIDKDFATNTNDTAYITAGRSGARVGGFWEVDSYTQAMKDPKVSFVLVPYPTRKLGEPVHLRRTNYNYRGYEALITASNKYPVETVKWLDYNYSDEGHLLFNFGIEGQTFTYVNGKPKHTDMIVNNPKVPYGSAQHIYLIQNGPFVREWREYQENYSPVALSYDVAWEQGGDHAYWMPPVTLTSEEGGKHATIYNDIETYVSEMTIKMIMGLEPLTKYSDFVAQIKKMGIEEAIKLQQAALDRYNNRR